MSQHLWAMLDDYLARASVSEAALARQVGIKPQTLSSWKHRGYKTPPEPQTLRTIARVVGAEYSDVLSAVLKDTGYVSANDRRMDFDPFVGLSAVQRALVLGIVQELREGPADPGHGDPYA